MQRKINNNIHRLPKEIDPQGSIRWDDIITEFNSARERLFGDLGKRGTYLWDWVYTNCTNTQLQSNSYRNIINERFANNIKTLGVLWDVLIDDIVDELDIDLAKEMTPYLLDDLAKGKKEGLSSAMIDYILYSKKIYSLIYDLCSHLPYFKRYHPKLIYEYNRLSDTMRYSLSIRENASNISLHSYIDKLSNNMHMRINGTIDLMCIAEELTPEKLSDIQTIFTIAQRMGRIGNSITTYERELPKKDFSSEIIAFLLEYNFIEPIHLQDTEYIFHIINKTDIENTMWKIWWNYYKLLLVYQDKGNLKELNLDKYIKGIIKLKSFHKESRGKK